jgi:hypothetical protein
MSDTCPTVKIDVDGVAVVINASDFDPKVHKEWAEPKPAKAAAPAAPAPAKAEPAPEKSPGL